MPTDVEKLVQYIRANFPPAIVPPSVQIGGLPSPFLHPSLCVLDAVYSAQQHYSAVDDK